MSDKKLFGKIISEAKNEKIQDWKDIVKYLDGITDKSPQIQKLSKDEFDNYLKKGIAFITYDYGIDGVSIEITKYAQALENIFGTDVPLHFIGGDFYDKADIVLKPRWKRFHIPNMNGWSKWYGGKWFSKLFYEDMPKDSEISQKLSQEIWNQSISFAEKLGTYMIDSDINMIIPVNILSNPGNVSIALALVIVTELLGTYVINSNHDYYWEGGKPESERKPNEKKGPRDHFFRNVGNKSFFEMFDKLYPWNGKRYLQVNINTIQSNMLIEKFGFEKNRVLELGTAVSDEFLERFTAEDQKLIRKKMNYILSNGNDVIKSLPIKDHMGNLSNWIKNQKPLVCGYSKDLTLDLSQDKMIYCLQPTRVIARKRIEMDFEMLKELMSYKPFLDVFGSDKEYKLIVHITGPVPIEHQVDLERVLNSYISLCDSVSNDIANRIFVGFSVGTEDHPSLKENNLDSMSIEEIYRLATVILFPSETEGRGLPIVESSASSIPIICSRYYPESVFKEVVGEDLVDEKKIKYMLFPEREDGYSDSFKEEVTGLLLNQDKYSDWKEHNRNAVTLRYSRETIKSKFSHLVELLSNI